MSIGNILLLIVGIVAILFVIGLVIINIPWLNDRIKNKPMELVAATVLLSGLILWIGACLLY